MLQNNFNFLQNQIADDLNALDIQIKPRANSQQNQNNQGFEQTLKDSLQAQARLNERNQQEKLEQKRADEARQNSQRAAENNRREDDRVAANSQAARNDRSDVTTDAATRAQRSQQDSNQASKNSSEYRGSSSDKSRESRVDAQQTDAGENTQATSDKSADDNAEVSADKSANQNSENNSEQKLEGSIDNAKNASAEQHGDSDSELHASTGESNSDSEKTSDTELKLLDKVAELQEKVDELIRQLKLDDVSAEQQIQMRKDLTHQLQLLSQAKHDLSEFQAKQAEQDANQNNSEQVFNANQMELKLDTEQRDSFALNADNSGQKESSEQHMAWLNHLVEQVKPSQNNESTGKLEQGAEQESVQSSAQSSAQNTKFSWQQLLSGSQVTMNSTNGESQMSESQLIAETAKTDGKLSLDLEQTDKQLQQLKELKELVQQILQAGEQIDGSEQGSAESSPEQTAKKVLNTLVNQANTVTANTTEKALAGLVAQLNSDVSSDKQISTEQLLQMVMDDNPEQLSALLSGERKVSLESLTQIFSSAANNLVEPAKVSTQVEVQGVQLDRTLAPARAEQQVTQRNEAVIRENILFNKQELAANLQQQVGMMLARNLKSVDIRLDPPELGSMQVKLSVNNDQASVSFVVSSQQAKDALEGSLPKLRELMEQHGMMLSDSDVKQEQNGSGGDGQDENGQQSLSRNTEEEENLEPEVTQQRQVNSPWNVDFYA